MIALPKLKQEKKSRLYELPILDVLPNPHQPRKQFNPSALIELSESIKQYGIIQPITVRRKGSKYELIAGERRLRASKLAGLEKITAMVIDVDNSDSAALALIENLQRENLNFIDEAEGYSNLILDFGLTQEELAVRIGKTQATIANKLRILRLDPVIKKMLREGNLTERHARALLKLKTTAEQQAALQVVNKKELNVKQTEDLIEDIISHNKKAGKKPEKKDMRVFHDLRIFVNTIKQAVDIMKQSGIDAVSEKEENDDYILYTVRISKRVNSL